MLLSVFVKHMKFPSPPSVKLQDSLTIYPQVLKAKLEKFFTKPMQKEAKYGV